MPDRVVGPENLALARTAAAGDVSTWLDRTLGVGALRPEQGTRAQVPGLQLRSRLPHPVCRGVVGLDDDHLASAVWGALHYDELLDAPFRDRHWRPHRGLSEPIELAMAGANADLNGDPACLLDASADPISRAVAVALHGARSCGRRFAHALLASRHRSEALPSTMVNWMLSPAVVEQLRECAAGTTDVLQPRSGHRGD